MVAPFLPDREDNFDAKVSNDGWNDENSDKFRDAPPVNQEDFNGYYYDKQLEKYQIYFKSESTMDLKNRKIRFKSERTSLTRSTNQNSQNQSGSRSRKTSVSSKQSKSSSISKGRDYPYKRGATFQRKYFTKPVTPLSQPIYKHQRKPSGKLAQRLTIPAQPRRDYIPPQPRPSANYIN